MISKNVAKFCFFFYIYIYYSFDYFVKPISVGICYLYQLPLDFMWINATISLISLPSIIVKKKKKLIKSKIIMFYFIINIIIIIFFMKELLKNFLIYF